MTDWLKVGLIATCLYFASYSPRVFVLVAAVTAYRLAKPSKAKYPWWL